MTAFTDTTGGSTVQPANPGYNTFVLNADKSLVWPPYASSNNYFAGLMDISPNVGGLNLFLPEAALGSVGANCIISNRGSVPFTLADASTNVIAVIDPNDVRFVYLTDNSSTGGLWNTVLFGKTNSAADASQYAGLGLKALNNTLAWAPLTTVIAGSTTLDYTYRGSVIVWMGGTGTLTLPQLASVGNDFPFEVRNAGSGVLTLAPQNSELIDASGTIQLQQTEAFFVHASQSSGSWYSVGRGRSATFNYTQLTKTLSGGTSTLSLTEASNVVQTYIGTLLSTQTVILPQVVQVYFISNQTVGAFTLTVKCPGTVGLTLVVPQGQNMVVFSDGINVINASTTSVGLTSLILGSGAAGTPIVTIGSGGNGFYAPGSNQLGATVAGTQIAQWDNTGYQVKATGNVTQQTVSSSGTATDVVDGPSSTSRSYIFRSSSLNRWQIECNNTPETGINAGSDYSLNAYADNGTLLGAALAFNRSTRIANFTFVPTAAGAQVLTASAAQPITNKVIDCNLNTVSNIPATALPRTVQITNVDNFLSVNGQLTTTAGVVARGLSTFYDRIISASAAGAGQQDGVYYFGQNANVYWVYSPSLGQVGCNIQVTAPSFANSSDERLKRNWKKVPKDFLAKLAQVDHGTFQWNRKAGKVIDIKQRHYGVSAQSLQKVAPESVKESMTIEGEKFLTAEYANVALVGVIELAKEVERLKEIIDGLTRK